MEKTAVHIQALDQRLRTLQGQVQRLQRVELWLEEHDAEERELEKRVAVLTREADRERADVTELERKGFKAALYRFLGTIDEKLAKERREATLSYQKLQEALSELDSLRFRIANLEEERKMLSGASRRLAAALEEKKKLLRSDGGEEAAQLWEWELSLGKVRADQRETRQALEAGKLLSSRIDKLLRLLEDAESWGMLDVAGGGLVADTLKYDAMEKAQQELDELQHDMDRFKRELADVSGLRELRLQIDGFLRFADYVFDGIFTDLAVLDQITQTKNQVSTIRNQVAQVMDHLETSLEQAQEQERSVAQGLEDWLIGK